LADNLKISRKKGSDQCLGIGFPFFN